jgi:hypothetical protein
MEKHMTKHDVSRATGESLRTIQGFRFSLLLADDQSRDADYLEASPQVVDWDQAEADRLALAVQA